IAPIIANSPIFLESKPRRMSSSADAAYTRNNMLRERLEKVEERIQNAARRAGRARSDITLIAVTKKFPASIVREAYDLGLRKFGENYVQEFEGKHPAVADLADTEFHLIGHLQSNKSRVATDIFQVIQTVDSKNW